MNHKIWHFLKKYWLKILIICVAVIIIVCFCLREYMYQNGSPNLSFLNSEISAYLLRCEKTNSDGSCSDEVAVPEITFKVYPKQQYVVSITKAGGINKLSPCTIVDLENWECNPTADMSLGFTKGSYSMSTTNPNPSIDLSKITVVSEKVWQSYPLAQN